jgi:transposase InsO family protein
MIFSSVKQHRDIWPVRVQCKALGVSASGYYAWLKRQPSKRAVANQNLLGHICRIHWDSHKRYGSPRVHAALRAEGHRVSRRRVEKLMRLNDLQAIAKRRVRVTTTDSKHNLPIAPNVLDRNFGALSPNEKWLADITYIFTAEGWLYLAAVLDLYSRKIVGWAMRDHMRTELPLAALTMAIQRQRPQPGLIHHSDRGSQYASHDYQNALAAKKIRPSMSRKGNCWDNAPMESFFHTLKTELVHHKNYVTKEEAKRDLFQYIEGYYNRQRIHSSINYLTPEQMELKAA